MLLLPAFLLLAMLTALGFGLWLSALNVRYRDVNYLVPFLVQIWMYLTPVIYGTTLIPEQYPLAAGAEPHDRRGGGLSLGAAGQLPGRRRSRLARSSPSRSLITLLVLVSGLVFFRRTERTFADVI